MRAGRLIFGVCLRDERLKKDLETVPKDHLEGLRGVYIPVLGAPLTHYMGMCAGLLDFRAPFEGSYNAVTRNVLLPDGYTLATLHHGVGYHVWRHLLHKCVKDQFYGLYRSVGTQTDEEIRDWATRAPELLDCRIRNAFAKYYEIFVRDKPSGDLNAELLNYLLEHKDILIELAEMEKTSSAPL